MLLWIFVGVYIIWQVIKHNPIEEKSFISTKLSIDKWQ